MKTAMAIRIVASAKKLGMEAKIMEIRDAATGRLQTAVAIGNHAAFECALVGATKGYAAYKKAHASLKSGPLVIGGREYLAFY